MTRTFTHSFSAFLLFLIVLGGAAESAWGQCVRVLDPRAANTPTYRPLKRFRCMRTGDPATSNFTLTFQNPASNFTIDWGDGNVITYPGPLTTVTHTYATTGTMRYSVTYAGCTTDTVKGDYINDFNTTVPGIGFITPPAGYTNKRCVPEALTIINASPNMNGFTEFLIDWGDRSQQVIDYNSYLQNITHVYQPFTTGCNVKISVIYQNLCGATPGGLAPTAVYGEYYFMDRDSARLTPANIIVCAPTTVTINDMSKLNCLDSLNREIKWEAIQGFTNPLPYPGNGTWRGYNSGGARTQVIPAALFYPIPSDSTYRIRMSIRNQCGPDSTTATIRIVAPRKPQFVNTNNNVCPGSFISFTNSTPNPFGAQSYFWEWGDGSSETNNSANVSHQYNVGGDYWVKLHTIVNGYNNQTCERVDSLMVSVKKTASPNVAVNPKLGCDSLIVKVENNTQFAGGATWTGWNLGGTPNTTAGTGILPSNPTSNPSLATVISQNMADTSAIVNLKTYGRYRIRLRAQSGGCPEIEDADTVYIYPTPKIRWKLRNKMCLGQSLEVRDSSRVIETAQKSLTNDWNHISWILDYGDGTIINSTGNLTNNFDSPGASGRLNYHTYAAVGTYTVRLLVRNKYGCWVKDSTTVRVLPVVNPVVSFVQDPCDPSKITIRNASSLDTAKYEFTIRRNATLYTRITHTVRDTFQITLPYSGPADTTYYQITLRAVTGTSPDTCSNATAPLLIKVTPSPVALFSVSQADGCSPLTGVQFFNNSYNLATGVSYTLQWRFGNGNTFTGDNPPLQNYVNTTALNRRDTARLTLVTPGGCRFTYQREIITYPQPNARIVAPDSICHNASITFSATGNGIATYLWRFTDLDGTTSTSATPTRVFPNTGLTPRTYTVELEVRTASGCLGTVSKIITVFPLPTAGFTASPEEVCSNGSTPVNFDAAPGSTGAQYYFWDFGDGQSGSDSTSGSVNHLYPANGGFNPMTYTATLRVKSDLGCVSQPYSRTITVRPAVQAIFAPDTDQVCAPQMVNFANLGYRTGVDYQWFVKTEGNPGIGSPFSPNAALGGFRFNFTNPGNQPQVRYVVTLVAAGQTGFPVCSDTLRDTITVYGLPTANFGKVLSPASSCTPVNVVLTPDTSVNATAYVWSFGDASPNQSNTQPVSVAHSYVNGTNIDQTFSISLTVLSNHGCQAVKTDQVTVKPVPSAAFTLANTLGCGPLQVTITNTSSPSSDNFTWLVNGAPYNFDRNPGFFTFDNTSATDTARYAIRLVARSAGNACVDTSTPQWVRVLPKPQLIIAPDKVNGCSPLNVTVSTTGTAGTDSLAWFVKPQGSSVYTPMGHQLSTANFNTVLSNTGASSRTYTIKAIAMAGSFCKDSSEVTIEVYPQNTAAMVVSDTIGCSPLAVTFANTTGSPASNSFSWRVNGIERSTNPVEFQQTLINTSTTRDTVYSISLIAANTTYGCPSTVTRQVRVKPVPAADFGISLNPTSACSPVQATFNYLNASGASQYFWTFGSGTDTLLTTLDTAIVKGFVNNGLMPVTRMIRLKASNAFGCAVTVDKPLIVNPGVVAGLFQNANQGCSPVSVTFTSTSSAGADQLEWMVDGVVMRSGQSFTQAFQNLTSSPITYRIKLIARNSQSPACVDTAYGQVLVQPTPMLTSFTANPISGCSPLDVAFEAQGLRFDSLNWDFGDGTRFDSTAAALGHTFQNFSGLNNTIYTARVIALNGSGCSDTLEKPITVRPGTKAIIRTSDSAACTPLRAQLIGASSLNANTYEWDFGDGQPFSLTANPVHVFANNTDTIVRYRVRLVASRTGTSCPDTAYTTISVFPKPLARLTPADTAGCQPLQVRYTNQSVGADSIVWTMQSFEGTAQFSNRPSIDTVFTNANPSILAVTTQLEAFNQYGCSAKAQNTVRVGPFVQADFSTTIDSGCTPLSVRFINGSAPGTQAIWLVDGTPASNNNTGFNRTFYNFGSRDTVYHVGLVVSNPLSAGCADTIYKDITVFAKPDAGNLVATPSQGCSPLTVTLIGSATGAASYYWDLRDGTTYDTVSQLLVHTFENNSLSVNQNFRIMQISISQHGCRDTARTNVLVRPGVRADFTMSDTAGCTPFNVQLNSGSSFNANLFTWDFGDGQSGSTTRNPNHLFENETDTLRRYTVTLTADKSGVGCPSTAQKVVTVFPKPNIDITPIDTTGCQPFALGFNSLSLGADSIRWSFEDGDTTIGVPFRPHTMHLLDTVFTNGTSAMKQITALFEVTNQYGCTDLAQRIVKVQPFVQAGFAQSTESGCSPLRVQFDNLSAEGNKVKWFVDGTLVSQNASGFSYTFLNVGQADTTYTITLVAGSRFDESCSDTIRKVVRVFGVPDAGVITANPESGCSPLLVQFDGGATGADRFQWNFDDGVAFDTMSQHVEHTFVNNQPTTDRTFRAYMVAITNQGCRDTAFHEIVVKPIVIARFDVSDTAGCAPLGVQFTNASTNANFYQWDFGDGSAQGFQQNPFKTFQNRTDSVVTYTVTMTADKNGVGCPSVATRQIKVYPQPVAEFIPADTAGCQPFAVHFEDRSRLAQTYTWTFSGPGNTVTHAGVTSLDSVFTNDGSQLATVNVRLTIASQYGCAAEKSHNVRVFPKVQAGLAASADSGCSPLKVRFENQSAAGNQVTWLVNGDYISNAPNSLEYTFVNETDRDSVYHIMLVAEHPQSPGCVDTVHRYIKVFNKPTAGLITASPEAGCSPLSVDFQANAIGAMSYTWTFSDGGRIDTSATLVGHVFENPGSTNLSFTTTLIAISAHGCRDTTTKAVTVRPPVRASITGLNLEGCTPLASSFTSAGSANATRFEWDFGDGGGSINPNPSHNFVNETDSSLHYTVRLVADRPGSGCPDTAYAQVLVHPTPIADLSASVQEGCSPLPVTLRNNSAGQNLASTWIISNGLRTDTIRTNVATLDTVFQNNSSQRITIWVELRVASVNGCTAFQRIPIYVNPVITAQFRKPTPGCAPLTVRFENLSRNPDDNYEWDFGDGSPTSSDKNPQHIFRYSGPRDTAFVVTLYSRSNPAYTPQCEVVYRDTVRVSGQPVAQFTFLPDNILRLPDNVITIQNNTPNRDAWTYTWSFGDGTVGAQSDAQFTHLMSGLTRELLDTTVWVTMRATSPYGCSDSVRKQLFIMPVKPVADFGPEASGCAPVDVVFQNNSRWANSYYWQFGDGTSSTEQSPSHRYSRPGTYTVRLIVSGPGGADTLERADLVHVYEMPDARFSIFPKAPRQIRIPEEQMECYVLNEEPSYTYLWDFGDGVTSTDMNPVHQYLDAGKYPVTLTVTTQYGCRDTDTLLANVTNNDGTLLKIPNAFSPNLFSSNGGKIDGSEGSNDIFYPVTVGATAIKLQIFNRWGEFLYQSTTLNQGWDGYYQGKLCPADTYVFMVEVRFANGEIKKKVGDVTLVR